MGNENLNKNPNTSSRRKFLTGMGSAITALHLGNSSKISLSSPQENFFVTRQKYFDKIKDLCLTMKGKNMTAGPFSLKKDELKSFESFMEYCTEAEVFFKKEAESDRLVVLFLEKFVDDLKKVRERALGKWKMEVYVFSPNDIKKSQEASFTNWSFFHKDNAGAKNAYDRDSIAQTIESFHHDMRALMGFGYARDYADSETLEKFKPIANLLKGHNVDVSNSVLTRKRESSVGSHNGGIPHNDYSTDAYYELPIIVSLLEKKIEEFKEI